MKFSDIPKFVCDGSYRVEVELEDIERMIDRYIKNYQLEMNPDFQRGHVWTEEQQIAFVEFILSGGRAPAIRFNHPGWQRGWEGSMVCVDGLQRITAILRFINNEIKAHGHYYREFEGYSGADITIIVNNLKTRREVLQWYLELNDGGTPHTKEEIARVRDLLAASV